MTDQQLFILIFSIAVAHCAPEGYEDAPCIVIAFAALIALVTTWVRS